MRKFLAGALLAVAAFLAVPSPGTAGEGDVPTIAVMPFSNVNKDKETDWLAEGIAETLTTKLGSVQRIRIVERQRIDAVLDEVSLGQSGVIDPESAARAGKVLGAETVVTGAYQKMGEKLRLTARFVKVETGIVSNTAMVTGNYNDIFSLEDDMADNILNNLGIEASDAEKRQIAQNPTASVAAYKNYTEGVSLMKQDRFDDAKAYLDEAVREDPNFSAAREELAFVEWARPSANSSLYLKKIDRPSGATFDAMIRAARAAGMEVKSSNRKQGVIRIHQSMSLLHGGHDIKVEIKSLKNASGVRIFSQAEKVFLIKIRPVYDWGQSRSAIEKLVKAFERELYRRRS
ncbi:MAG TPA: FlgO family outer membrane protein [Syntrophales bacterium]|nr:FlgO family outer membrane protein [Syntrophales bacterium]HQB29649.1 FlgO family outer membrane protein [Syntrophales bacterium]